MKIAAFNQLKKLMQLTTSDNDNEALGALRKANRLIVEADTTWERVFGRLVRVEHDVEEFVEPVSRDPSGAWRRRYFNDLLTDVEQYASGDFVDFVESLRTQFDRSGQLSAAQVDALERSRERHRRDRRA